MIALIAVSGRGTFAMWGYPLWLFVGLWIVLMLRAALDRARLAHVVAHWSAVFLIFAIVFLVNYSVLPLIDHRYRAVFYPGDKLAAVLTQRFHDATGTKLRYVIGAMWDGGNLAHYSPDQPEVLIDGLPRRAPWIDLADLRKKGAMVVWSGGDTAHLPAAVRNHRRQRRGRRAVRLPMRRGAMSAGRSEPHSRLGDSLQAAAELRRAYITALITRDLCRKSRRSALR